MATEPKVHGLSAFALKQAERALTKAALDVELAEIKGAKEILGNIRRLRAKIARIRRLLPNTEK